MEQHLKAGGQVAKGDLEIGGVGAAAPARRRLPPPAQRPVGQELELGLRLEFRCLTNEL